MAGERGARRAVRGVGQPQRLRDRVVHQRRVVDGGQLDQPHAVAEAILHSRRRVRREAGLADAADAGHRHQPGVVQLPGQCGEFALPPDESIELRGEVARPAGPR
ncbi:hypothetical protein ADK38_09305 [Streptomyces varsoviensis]|uniref:Uncharacterized protein n=1 Tax=Streptomyces varsoviensis TaxID=67373 RepID=A0ABR5JA87_9ACTN|nr:hypothetical protein ADK38_09305 [Streptomyces varsoviensis]